MEPSDQRLRFSPLAEVNPARPRIRQEGACPGWRRDAHPGQRGRGRRGRWGGTGGEQWQRQLLASIRAAGIVMAVSPSDLPAVPGRPGRRGGKFWKGSIPVAHLNPLAQPHCVTPGAAAAPDGITSTQSSYGVHTGSLASQVIGRRRGGWFHAAMKVLREFEVHRPCHHAVTIKRRGRGCVGQQPASGHIPLARQCTKRSPAHA